MSQIIHVPREVMQQRGWLAADVPRDPREAPVLPELPEPHVPSSLLGDSVARALAAQREERAGFLLGLWDDSDFIHFDHWVKEFNDDGILTPLGMGSLDAYAHAAVVMRRTRK